MFGSNTSFVSNEGCLHLRSTITSPLFGDGRGTRKSPDICGFFLTIFLVTNMSTSQLTLVSVLCIDPHTSTVLIMYFPRNIRFRSSKNNEHLYICLDRDGGCEATEEGGALLNNTPSSSSFLSCLGIVNHTPHDESSSSSS